MREENADTLLAELNAIGKHRKRFDSADLRGFEILKMEIEVNRV